MPAMIKNFADKYYAFSIALLVFLTDQTLKVLIAEKMLLNEKFNLITNILSVTKVYNTGAAFGILKNATFFLIFFSMIVIFSIAVYLIKTGKYLSFFEKIAWGLVLGGTLGNFVDRITLKYVLDFISIDFVNFPIFNIADLSINIGVMLLLIHILFDSKETGLPKELKS